MQTTTSNSKTPTLRQLPTKAPKSETTLNLERPIESPIHWFNSLPDEAIIRIWHIVGDKKRNIQPLLPICKTSFLTGIKDGRYPQPIKLGGSRSVGWTVKAIRELLAQLQGGIQ